jgi:hypothetical protein
MMTIKRRGRGRRSRVSRVSRRGMGQRQMTLAVMTTQG